MFSYPKQRAMLAAFTIVGLLLYFVMVSWTFNTTFASSTRGYVVGVTALVASPIGFALLVALFEHDGPHKHRLRTVFTPRYQSAAFLADIFGLAPALAIAAAGWHTMNDNFMTQWWWFALVAPALGFTFSAGFHYVLDAPGYREHNPTALLSPTKVWHNAITYPVLFSSMMALVLPYVFVHNAYMYWIIGFVGVWLCGVVYDGIRNPPLDPNVLHIPWNPEKFRPLV